VYDLAPTRLVDGPPPDASPRCPQLGETPDYAGTLRQVIAQSCWDYTLSTQAGVAMAVCDQSISEGPIGTTLTPVTAPLTTSDDAYEKPRLTPDANRMIVRHVITESALEVLETYDRVDATWRYQAPLTELGAPDWLSNIVPSERGYRLIARTLTTLEEWEYAGTWQRVRTMVATDLGLAIAVGPMLAPDGLGLVTHDIDGALGTYRAYYADRASQDAPFGIARPLTGLPTPRDYTISIAEGCTGAYLAGLDAIFFVRRR
jgi:hypothetical protein